MNALANEIASFNVATSSVLFCHVTSRLSKKYFHIRGQHCKWRENSNKHN